MRGQVAEQDMAVLTVGQPADVRLVGSMQPFEGRVRLLGAVIDPLTRLGDIRISVKPNPALRPGAFAPRVGPSQQGRTAHPAADRRVV